VEATLLIFFLVTSIPAGFQFKQRRDLEERAVTAARTLHEIYVLTPNQSVRLVYMNAWQRNVCMEYVVDDAPGAKLHQVCRIREGFEICEL
jgi:hypothetical protein